MSVEYPRKASQERGEKEPSVIYKPQPVYKMSPEVAKFNQLVGGFLFSGQ